MVALKIKCLKNIFFNFLYCVFFKARAVVIAFRFYLSHAVGLCVICPAPCSENDEYRETRIVYCLIKNDKYVQMCTTRAFCSPKICFSCVFLPPSNFTTTLQRHSIIVNEAGDSNPQDRTLSRQSGQ